MFGHAILKISEFVKVFMVEQKLKKLPLGLTTFSEIIRDDYVYVDKTESIYQLVTGGKYYFLSRPRRFGKSLLVSTLTEFFSGNRELFKHLWIGQSDYDWPVHPVIRFDFSEMSSFSVQCLQEDIIGIINEIAALYGIEVPASKTTITGKFKSLIIQLSKINKVVILIDEYDKPILDHIDNPEEAKAQREILKSLYSVIKGSDQYLKFVLLTGVSKFAKTSVFSGINNLSDISMDRRYATMLGYLRDELGIYFGDYLERFSKKLSISVNELETKLVNYYDGYHFTKESAPVFNPYSVMLSLDAQEIEDYWFKTGTPTFLVKLLRKHDYDVDTVTHPVINKASLDAFEPDDIELAALLFQTGYLTIKGYDSATGNYTLGVPNREVSDGLTIQLVDAFTGLQANKSIQYAQRIFKTFVDGDMTKLEQVLQEFFNKMPYTVHVKSESQLQFVLYAIFALIGVTVDPEVTTSLGRADLVVGFPKLVYVIELKFNKTAHEALEQIQDKKYYEKYENIDKQITLVGINFDSETKTVSLESQVI